MRKKSLAVLLVLAMLLGLFPATALADEPGTETESYSVIVEDLGSVNSVAPDLGVSLLDLLGTDFAWSEETGRAYYNQLDEASQKIYNAILGTNLASGYQATTTIAYEGTIGQDTLGDLMTPALLALVYDNPKLSWLSGVTYTLGYSGVTGGNTWTLTVTIPEHKTVDNTGTVNFGGISKINVAIRAAKDAIDDELTEGTASRYDTVKAIHDYVCENVTYASEEITHPFYQTLYSAFYTDAGETASAVTVCAGYAKAFKVLCDEYDIPCILVSGFGNSNGNPTEKDAHMWNYVRMEDGNWYAVDCTWDDQTGQTYYDFFLVGQNTVSSDGFGSTAFSASHKESGKWSTSGNYTFAYPTLAEEKYDPYAISNVALTIAAPAAGATPETEVSGEGYTGTIAWTPEVATNDTFQYNTAYTATVALTATGSYSFKDTLTATVNGETASVSVSSDSSNKTATVTYGFSATGKASTPSVSVSGGNSISVANSGETKALTLNVSGLVEGCNEITWTLTEEADVDEILTLPTQTTGTLNNGPVSLGDLSVAANTIGQPKKSATVKISFSGNESSHYADLPEEITVTINLAAGESQNADLEITSTSGSWNELTYGYSTGNSVTYTITNTGNVDATNVTASVSGDVFTVGGDTSATITPGNTATVTVTFPTGKNAGTYTDTLTITSKENSTGITQELSQTVSPKELAVTWKGENSSDNDFSWVYTGEEIKPTASVTEAGVTLTTTGATDAGTHTSTASINPANPNYTLTNNTQSFTITKATRTIDAPTQSSVSKNTVTLSPVTPSAGVGDGTVQYGYAATNTSGDVTAWQDSNTFTGLSPQTTYYFFARVTGGTNYENATSTGTEITISDKDSHMMSDFNQTSLSLTYGDTDVGQTVTCSTGGEVTYSSSSPETVEVNSSTGALTIRKVTGETPVTITATAAATDGYAETTKTYTVTVAPKQLTITGLTATDRDYTPGDDTVELTGGTLNGVISGDDVTVTMPTSGTMTDANARENKTVSVGTPTLSGDDAGNYTLKAITGITVNIAKATPNVGTVSKTSPATIYTSTDPAAVTLSHNGTTSGTVNLAEGTQFTEGTNNYTWVFAPADTTNYKTATGEISLNVVKNELTGLAVTAQPSITAYQFGQAFDPAGMSVSAYYINGDAKPLDNSVLTVAYQNGSAFAVGDTKVTLSYTEAGVTKSCEVTLTVSKASWQDKSDSVALLYSQTAVQTVSLDGMLPAGCGTVTISGLTGTSALDGFFQSVSEQDGNIVFQLGSGLTEGDAGKTGTITFTVATQNYADFTVTVTVTLTKLTQHTITFDANDGSGTMNAVTVTDGTNYTLPACGFTAPSGMRFKCWAFNSASGNQYSVGDTFTYVTANMVFYAVWEPVPTIDPTPVVPSTPSTSRDDDDDGDYSVSVPSSTSVEGGSISVSPRSADKGDTVSITVRPKTGYVLDKLTVTTRTGAQVELTRRSETRYTFIMPAGSISVQVSFIPEEQAAEMDFADVPESFWAVNEIQWAFDNGYMTGTSAVSFNPGGTVNRQQVWMILARMAGADPASMAEAKAWAVANGISDGTTPTGAVTRQQLVALLYRFAVQNGYDTSARADLSGYPDAASVSGYASDAMAWAVANGIIGGTTQGTLNPAGDSNRAQMAVILWRFYQTTAG